jgi:dephospho-CoA kinase
MKRKIKAAVTGGIGGGKSSFCKYIADKGYPVISADEISKEILVKNKQIKQQIVKTFGKDAYTGERLNNKYLAEKVFSSASAVKKINAIVHPAVISEIDALMKSYLKKHSIVFVEAALIYEAGMEELFDYVIVVTADEEVRKKRAFENGINEDEFNKRNQNQMPEEKKKKKADFVFVNNGIKADLFSKADMFLKLLGIV